MKLATHVSTAQIELNSVIQVKLNSEDLSLQVSIEVKGCNVFWPASLSFLIFLHKDISQKKQQWHLLHSEGLLTIYIKSCLL